MGGKSVGRAPRVPCPWVFCIFFYKTGANDENRTHVPALRKRCSATELHWLNHRPCDDIAHSTFFKIIKQEKIQIPIKSQWPELNWRPRPSLSPPLLIFERARLYLRLHKMKSPLSVVRASAKRSPRSCPAYLWT